MRFIYPLGVRKVNGGESDGRLRSWSEYNRGKSSGRMEESGGWVNVFGERLIKKDTSGLMLWCVGWSGRLEVVVGRIKDESVETTFQ